MISNKEVDLEIEYLSTIKNITETYEEIAASRMQRIRSSVLQSRDFVFEVNNIYQQVKRSYKKEVEKLAKTHPFMSPRNGKTLFVLVSANTGLYGEVIRKTYNLFTEHFKKEKGDVAIIGRLGLQFFKEEFKNASFTYFDLPDTQIDEASLKKIIENIMQYEQIIVFYEQFVNIVSQEPIATSISGDQLPWEEKGSEVRYFFEPSLQKVLAFFEKQIFASIFEQVIFESELAKFASRMVSLDTATVNARGKLKLMTLEKDRIKHRAMNKKQAEGLIGISLISRP